MIDPETDAFLNLLALIQEGIDAAKIALEPALMRAPGTRTIRAITSVMTKLDEAELWLGAAVLESTKETV